MEHVNLTEYFKSLNVDVDKPLLKEENGKIVKVGKGDETEFITPAFVL